MSFGWWCSKFLYPDFTWKMVFGSTLSYIAASLLAALLALALGSIVQAVVEMKVYLVICAVVSFLII